MNKLSSLIRSTLMKYGLSSGVSFLVDYSLFAILLDLRLPILPATYAARACSCLVNFALNRRAVFRSSGHPLRQLLLYLLLVIVSATVSGLAVTGLHSLTPIHPLILKFCVEVVLFFVNYLVQKHLIFRS